MMVRKEIIRFLQRELVGPRPGLPFVQLNGEEVLPPEDPPRLRYGVGILFPASSVIQEQDEENNDVTDDESDTHDDSAIAVTAQNITGEAHEQADERGDSQSETDYEINRTNDFFPSALGITALVRMPETICVEISTAQYYKEKIEGFGYTNQMGAWVPTPCWFRKPLNETIVLHRSELCDSDSTIVERNLQTHNPETKLSLHIFSRSVPTQQPNAGGFDRFVTFTIINNTLGGSQYRYNENCFFQCSIKVRSENQDACFLDYPEQNLDNPEQLEELTLKMLYRHRKVYAVGHGCAADWKLAENGCTEIFSESMPCYEISPIIPAELEKLDLRMSRFAFADSDEIIDTCERLANDYEKWIEEKKSEADEMMIDAPDLFKAAMRNVQACSTCLSRIRRGINVIRENSTARHAFVLMNQAMVMQGMHYKLATDEKRQWKSSSQGLNLERHYDVPDYKGSDRSWRPFQLAFILLSLRSIVLENAEDYAEREIVDLIWFPTGGGKTEAYLGLTAFAIFWRRLCNPCNTGTTALMRYTLRLLTTQQFQRAASLICACESLRRNDPSEALGLEPITIGLWVGGGVTPNTEKSAVSALDNILNDRRENPFIVLSCPWCGAQMGPVKHGRRVQAKGYRRLQQPRRIRLVCEDDNCEFNSGEGLPLSMIDEHIYNEPPTLVVGTVDKFALLPWRPEARALFGLNSTDCDPPDLIIQDELHLISGPLGSMVGHYETVIDALTHRNSDGRSVPAKIIASTATIARAGEQVGALYGGRTEFLFPPQGLRAGDSYFAEERPDLHGRTYVGVFGSGLSSQVTTEVRALSALLQAPLCIEGTGPEEIDPYWTAMVYFNSIRELGRTATRLKADIPEYINVTGRRLGLNPQMRNDQQVARRRFINEDMELTSRIQNSEITEYMERLFARYEAQPGTSRPVDICLATNMIQVGLDIQRLSLMLIIGQPKTASEYIQASSRVGRSGESPGLVATLLSPSKPRDRSHFEHFRAFHQSIYRSVEPTSVTPFAAPVTERALHALVITLARFWGDEKQRDYPDAPSENLESRIQQAILDRVEAVEPDETERVKRVLERIFEEWQRLPPDRYGDFGHASNGVPFMYPSGTHPEADWYDRSIPTPSSMRNVDASCNASVINSFPEFDDDLETGNG